VNKFEVEGLPNVDVDLNDFHSCWWFLVRHPTFFYAPSGKWENSVHNEPGFEENLDIHITKVCPLTDRIEQDPEVNTLTQVWLECGGWQTIEDYEDSRGQACHDPDLDVGGATFEEAICNLAKAVLEKEGGYPCYTLCSHCLRNYPAGPTDPNEESYCSELCEEHGPYEHRTEPSGHGTVRWIAMNEFKPCVHFPPRD
jgi:hypothetical protein